jgi:hypothetical protein
VSPPHQTVIHAKQIVVLAEQLDIPAEQLDIPAEQFVILSQAKNQVEAASQDLILRSPENSHFQVAAVARRAMGNCAQGDSLARIAP